MASKEWNEIDLQKHQFEDYYCAFLDILGYKDKLKLFFQGKFNLYGRVQRAMNNAGVEMSPADSPDGIIINLDAKHDEKGIKNKTILIDNTRQVQQSVKFKEGFN